MHREKAPSGMRKTGLRERKRLARRLQILEAAAVAFQRGGFDETRIDDIAAIADVAPGTVYNYFPTKDALLLGLASHHRSQSPKALSALIAHPPSDPTAAFRRFYVTISEESLKYLDKPLWRHAHAAMTAGGWHEFGSERWSHEEELIGYQSSLIRLLQHTGSIPMHVDHRALAEVIHSCAFFWWQRFLVEDAMSLKDFIARLTVDLQCIFDALAGSAQRTTRANRNRATGSSMRAKRKRPRAR